jgi:protein-L-isoaspartate(D-aspartate) O-methyltransferase
MSSDDHAIIDPDTLVCLLSRTVRDERVLAAVRTVPRPEFVPAELRAQAWHNLALPIGSEQTISQPLVVARMLELLRLQGDELVLDIGTGSGYHAALLARLARRVISVERRRELSRKAAASLAAAGIENVELVIGDGSLGLPERAPFDAINVAAAGDLEALRALGGQLAASGRLVAPLVEDASHPDSQRLVVLRADPHGLSIWRREPVRFVPLISDAPG